MEKLTAILSHFDINLTQISNITPLGNGLINDTYLVDGARRYVLQRINHSIFTNVEMLQANIAAVSRHLQRKDEAHTLTLVPLRNSDRTYWHDGTNYWRLMDYIEGSHTLDSVTPELSYEAGVAFGRFQANLVDIPETLGEVIPNFHNVEFRLQQLRHAVAADPCGRVAEVQPLLDEIFAAEDEMTFAERLYRAGQLPKRICHCDTKVNNMLFDDEGNVMCVIDLDTVMPSFVFSDYGDFLRTAANTAPEDEPDTTKIEFRRDIFEAFTRGYLHSAAGFLTPTEIQHLPQAVTMFPYMQAVRFLADYINGDTYYRTQYPTHNLVRTHAQLTLFRRAHAQLPYMAAFIAAL